MQSYLILFIASLFTSRAIAADISFNCDCIDHWFKHGRAWIRASSTDGCMALETVNTNIWALNAIPKPPVPSNNYPNLICSLNLNQCQWAYSVLDPVDDANDTSSSNTYDSDLGASEEDLAECEPAAGDGNVSS